MEVINIREILPYVFVAKKCGRDAQIRRDVVG